MYFSCQFHGHDCHLTTGKTHHPYNKNRTLEECRAKTDEITAFLKTTVGVNVIECWECEWEDEKQSNPCIQAFLEDNDISFKSVFSTKVTMPGILEKVRNGEFFGMVQCDIHVPDDKKALFADMPPIFKNVEVSIDDIGPHMKEYCKANKLMGKPRRSLIGSYFGKEILLTTPLLRWYLSHGLVVTDIQQIVEYNPKACFKTFGDTVTGARREGDKDADSKIKGETWKMVGNSCKYVYIV